MPAQFAQPSPGHVLQLQHFETECSRVRDLEYSDDAAPVAPVPMTPPPGIRSAAEKRLRLALRISFLSHTYSFAQVIGIYPA